MKLSDYVINFLVKEKIKHVFEVCGGATTHLLNSLYGRKDIVAISTHHEQASAMAAEGYSRINGNLGVAMATSGPGATNLITGIASCYFDSIPSLFITGQVNTYEYKLSRPIRQIGFQETDIVSMVKPITKYSQLVLDPKKIRFYLEKAVYLARSGRPGPVLLDIPMDIQRAEINPSLLKSFKKKLPKQKINSSVIKQILHFFSTASRPVILVGGGIRLAKAEIELLNLVQKTGAMVVVSLLGIDAFPHNHQSFVGMIGTYGNRYANLTIANADLLLVLGARLDSRQTGTNLKSFAREAKIIHVDIDHHELNCKIKSHLSVNVDLKFFLKTLNKSLINYSQPNLNYWRKKIKQYQDSYPAHLKDFNHKIQPNFFINQLSNLLPKKTTICVDVGQHQMWAAQSLILNKKQRFLTQGGMGALGSALAMAIGVAFAQPKEPVVVITGDGGFQFNIQELQTIVSYQLPIKIIMLNNHSYGMVRQFQEQYFESRFQSTVIGYDAPDFVKVVGAYQISAKSISQKKQIVPALKILFKDQKPMFLEINISSLENVWPKLSVNKPVEDQEPFLSRSELKKNMIVNLWMDQKK